MSTRLCKLVHAAGCIKVFSKVSEGTACCLSPASGGQSIQCNQVLLVQVSRGNSAGTYAKAFAALRTFLQEQREELQQAASYFRWMSGTEHVAGSLPGRVAEGRPLHTRLRACWSWSMGVSLPGQVLAVSSSLPPASSQVDHTRQTMTVVSGRRCSSAWQSASQCSPP